MIQLKLFTMQIVPLAFCFGVAYWLMVTATMQEPKLKSLGNTLGWSLITVALLSSAFAYYLLNNGAYCPGSYSNNKMMSETQYKKLPQGDMLTIPRAKSGYESPKGEVPMNQKKPEPSKQTLKK